MTFAELLQKNLTPVADGTYTIQSVNSALYMHADMDIKNGSAEQNTDAQIWNITAVDNGWYTIRTTHGKALTVENASAENGADIVITDYIGDASQRFRFLDTGGGQYALLTAVSGGNYYNPGGEDFIHV